jgi:hypothetical protein
MQFQLILVVLLLHLFWWALECSAIAPQHGRPMRTHGKEDEKLTLQAIASFHGVDRSGLSKGGGA